MSAFPVIPERPETSPVCPCSNEDVERIERFMMQLAKAHPYLEGHFPVSHAFQDGVYLREVLMQPSFVVGHEHKTEHYNMILSGRAVVVMHNTIIEAEPFMMIRSGVGVRKLLCVQEPMRWLTIHKNPRNLCLGLEEGSPEFAAQLLELESEIFKPSETFRELSQ